MSKITSLFWYALAFVAVAFFPGCAALKANVTVEAPTEGPAANVRVIIPPVSDTYRGVRAYPNSACYGKTVAGNGVVVSGQLIGFEKNLNGQRLGMPETSFSKQDRRVQAEIRVAANRPVTFRYIYPAAVDTPISSSGSSITYRRTYTGCTAAISFVPESNGEYELYFEDSTATVCPYVATKLVSPKAGNGVASATALSVLEVGVCPP